MNHSALSHTGECINLKPGTIYSYRIIENIPPSVVLESAENENMEVGAGRSM